MDHLRFVVVNGSASGQHFSLLGQQFLLVGSSSKAHIRLTDEGVEKRHAQLFLQDGQPVVVDLSGQGVFLRGKQRRQGKLRPGDEIGIGRAVLRVVDALSEAGANRARAVLRVLSGKNAGQVFAVGERMVLGRAANADIALLDMRCSRNHCRVLRRKDGFAVVDTSSNGTWLNEQRLEPGQEAPLHSGDRLKLGQTVIELVVEGAVPASRPPAPTAPQEVAPPAAAAVGRVAMPPLELPAPTPRGDAEFEFDLGELDEGKTFLTLDVNDVARRSAQTQRITRPRPEPAQPLDESGAEWAQAALSGDLERMGFAQVVQFLNMSQMTGELVIRAEKLECGVAFKEGAVIDAWGPQGAATSEACFYAVARLKKGQFAFRPDRPPRDVKITTGTLALLMEAMRQVDEESAPAQEVEDEADDGEEDHLAFDL